MRKFKIGGQFSGVGAFDQALMRLGINFENVYQAEWDKYARQTYLHNYENPIYYVQDVHYTPTEEITDNYGSLDIAMFSPPCQAFSLAGKRKGEEDKRGVLFYNSHEFIKINKPRFFIFENVKGLLSDSNGKTFQKWIEYLGGKSVNGNPVLFPNTESVPYHIYYKVLNAKNYGIPQNRERVFIVGIRDDQDNSFTWPKEEVLTKRLKDVLESDVDEKYYLSEKMIESFTLHCERHKEKDTGFQWQPKTKEDIANCLRANAALCPTDNTLIIGDLNKGGERGAVYSDESKIMSCLTATDYKQPKQIIVKSDTTSCNKGVAIGSIRGRNIDNPKSRKSGLETTQMLEINENGTSNCLTTVQKDNVVVEYNDKRLNKFIKENGLKPLELIDTYNQISNTEVTHTITTRVNASNNTFLNENYRIRKLTPRECFRLMDFPDSFTWPVSDSQAYKQAGNSICVGVLAKIIERLKLF